MKIKTREEITKIHNDLTTSDESTRVLLEVLLDIRDILIKREIKK